MNYIEYQDEHGTYSITRESGGADLSHVIEDFIIPVLLAAGYNQKTIDEYFVEV